MNLRDLISELEDLAAEFGDDVDVRLAHQPRWAFEYAIDQVVGVVTQNKRDGNGEAVVYLSEGQQIGYLPGAASVELGWSDRNEDLEEDDDDDEESAAPAK